MALSSSPVLLPLVLGLVLAGPAWAQDAPADAAAPAAEAADAVSGPAWTAGLRAEYVEGEKVVVPVTVRNPGTEPVTVPDLSARPWLVRFDMVLPDGRTISRYNTPPDVDPGTTVRLNPRGSRRVLLEVPGGFGDFSRFELVVRLTDGEQDTEIARQAVRRSRPAVGAVDLGPDRLEGARTGSRAVWVHKGAEGAEIMLHTVATRDARGPTAIRQLVHVDAPVSPWLAAQASGSGGGVAVAWSQGSGGIRVVRTDEVGGVEQDVAVDAPWPVAEVAGRPALVADGVLVPVWVPAPKGEGGELRLLSLDRRGQPGFPRVDLYAARPAEVRVLVDTSGAAHFMVRHDKGVDLYTVRPEAPQGPDALPPPGKRIWKPAPGLTLHDARFGTLPRTDDDPGGIAALLMVEQPGGLVGRWRDLKGERITDVPPVLVPEGHRLVAVAPDGATALGLLFVRDGKGLWLEGRDTRVELGPVPDQVQAVRDADGRPLLRVPGKTTPVELVTVPLPAPPSAQD